MPQQVLDEFQSTPQKIPLKIKLLHFSSVLMGLLCFASWIYIQNRYQDSIHDWTDWLFTLKGEGLLSISLMQASMLYLNFFLLIYLFFAALFLKDLRKEVFTLEAIPKIILLNVLSVSLALICLGYLVLLVSWFVLYLVPTNPILTPINLACFIMYNIGFIVVSIFASIYIKTDK